MPCDYSKYPKNWKEIRLKILVRAKNRCEICGVRNHALGARDKNGEWHDEDDIHSSNAQVGEELFGDFPNMIRIVLTVAHWDHDLSNNDPSNLKACCQKCHLDHDREQNTESARATRLQKRQQPEFDFK